MNGVRASIVGMTVCMGGGKPNIAVLAIVQTSGHTESITDDDAIRVSG
jgi:hypothetical protein